MLYSFAHAFYDSRIDYRIRGRPWVGMKVAKHLDPFVKIKWLSPSRTEYQFSDGTLAWTVGRGKYHRIEAEGTTF